MCPTARGRRREMAATASSGGVPCFSVCLSRQKLECTKGFVEKALSEVPRKAKPDTPHMYTHNGC